MRARSLLSVLAQGMAAASGAVAAIGWYEVARASLALPGPHSVAIRMIGTNVVAIAVSIVGSPWLMYVVAAVAFVPQGLYLLGTPGSWYVGAANVAYIIAALVLHNDASRQPPSRTA